MGYDMEMDDFHDEEEFNRKELERLKKEILDEAKKVVDNYVENPSDISGSVVNIHQNSPFLDSDEDGEPLFSGSRWTKVLRSKI
jgi:CRISPR/Cas system-associated endonuclease Cas3-HD